MSQLNVDVGCQIANRAWTAWARLEAFKKFPRNVYQYCYKQSSLGRIYLRLIALAAPLNGTSFPLMSRKPVEKILTENFGELWVSSKALKYEPTASTALAEPF
jgi:hypothetical protein